MRAPAAEQMTTPKRFHPPFENGDRMDQKTFHRLYEQTPQGFKAELIGGIVYMPSPTSFRHGRPHARVIFWLGTYAESTPGTDYADNMTSILGEESEPQPDALLAILPEYGGQIWLDRRGYVHGAAELVVEVANSSAAIDLHAKRLDYETAGVKEYYVVLARSETVVRFVRQGSRLIEEGADADGVIRSAIFPGLWLDPAGLFGAPSKQLRASLNEGLATPDHAAFVAKLEAKRAALAKKKR
jgi:Uma2 family endonuclease